MCVKFDFVLNVTVKKIGKMLKERGYSEKAIEAILEWYSKNTEDISISNTMVEKDVQRVTQMHKSGSFHCPYVKCGKVFGNPLVLTDMSRIPRETYYACPHCLSKVEVAVKDDKSLDSASIETSDDLKETPPLECPYHFGYLNDLPENTSAPDECLTCPKLIQCFARGVC